MIVLDRLYIYLMETIDVDGECGVVRGWGGVWFVDGVDREWVRSWMGVYGEWMRSWMGVYGEWRMDVLDESRMEKPQTKINMNTY